MGRYVVASNSSQAGYEMLSSASLPVYLDQTFHKMSLMVDLSIIGTFSSVIGRQLSPLIVNSMPLKKSYLGMLGATFIAAMTIGALANLHILTVMPLFGLMIVFRLLQAGTATAERTVIPSVLGKDQVAMESLRGTGQSWAEVASVLVQNGAAVIVVLVGTATMNLMIAPLFYLAALALLWSSLKIPKGADEARLASWKEKNAQSGAGFFSRVKSVFKNFATQVALGYKVVMHDLGAAFLGDDHRHADDPLQRDDLQHPGPGVRQVRGAAPGAGSFRAWPRPSWASSPACSVSADCSRARSS